MTQNETRILEFIRKAEDLREFISNRVYKEDGSNVLLHYDIKIWESMKDLYIGIYVSNAEKNFPDLYYNNIRDFNTLSEKDWADELASIEMTKWAMEEVTIVKSND